MESRSPDVRSRSPSASRAKRFNAFLRGYMRWDQLWFPAAVAVVTLVIGLVTRDLEWIVLSLLVGFCAFLGWAVWTHIDE
jgi:hypothetical protein